MKKDMPLNERVRDLLLARLRRRERREIWNRATRIGLLVERYHKMGQVQVKSYVLPAALGNFSLENLRLECRRLMVRPPKSTAYHEDHLADSDLSQKTGSRTTVRRRLLGQKPGLRRMLEAEAGSPPIGDVALALLITDAVARLNGEEANILSIMRQRQFRLLIQLPFADGTTAINSMIFDGIFGGDPAQREYQSLHGIRDTIAVAFFARRKIVLLDIQKEENDPDLRERLGRALQEGDSVVLLLNDRTPPPWAVAAADHYLHVPAISRRTIEVVIELHTADRPTDHTIDQAGADPDYSLLQLADLDVAITRYRASNDILQRLDNLTSFRKETALEYARKAAAKSGKGRSGGSNAVEVFEPARVKATHAAGGSKPIPRVEDLHGYGDAKKWAVDLKTDLQQWRQSKIEWNDISSKMLLHGPPGTGKTTFARALSHTLMLPLLSTSVATWLEPGYLGDVIKRIADTFATAREQMPCILFIDEFDGIGNRSGGRNRQYDEYWITVVNKVLECLDGSVKSEGVIVVGATNRIEAIDPALLRAGRLDRQVKIELPDLAALQGILRYHLRQQGREHEGWYVDSAGKADPFIAIAARLMGSSGADVEALVKESRSRARRQGRNFDLSDLEATLSKLRPPQSALLNRILAVHEAGHAIAFTALGVAMVRGISISEPSGGRTSVEFSGARAQFEDGLENAMAALIAGREAERLFFGQVATGSGGDLRSDLARASAIALQLEATLGLGGEMPLLYRHEYAADPGPILDEALKKRVNHRLERASERAKRLVQTHAKSIESLADLLERKLVVEGPELELFLAPLRGGVIEPKDPENLQG